MPRNPDTVTDPAEAPTLEDLLRSAMRSQSLGLRVGVPARVVSFDPGPPVPFVTAEIALQRVTYDERKDGETAQDYPPIPLCPVEYPRGGGYRIAWHLDPGDGGWLKFSDRALEQWMDAAQTVDPTLARAHALSDAVFVPGLHNRQSPTLAPVPPAGLTIEREDGSGGVDLSASDTRVRHALSILLGDLPPGPGMPAVARIGDTTGPDATMATWIAAAQVVLAGAAALLALPVPVAPTDFGVVLTGSAKVFAE